VSWTLTTKILKMQAGTIAAYAAGAAIYGTLVVMLFEHVFANHIGLIEQYNRIFPRGFLRVFNMGNGATSLGGFVAVQYLSLVWVIAAGAFVITASSGALAREHEHGRLELLLAYPIGRLRVYASQVAALLAGLIVIILATLAGLWAGAIGQPAALAVTTLWPAGVLCFAFALAVAGYGFLFSAVASERGRAVGAAVAVTLLFYLLHLVAQTWDQLAGLSRFTLFTYYRPQAAIDLGRVDVQALIVLLAVGMAGLILGAAVFRVRDL
jgi:ABC-2 type transport system permease protein